MTVGRTALVVFIVALMAAFSPGVLMAAPAGPAHGSAPIVPVGEELGPDELLDVDGAFWGLILGRLAIGGITWALSYFFTDADAVTAANLAVGAMVISCLP